MYYLASPIYNRAAIFSLIIFLIILILAFLGSGALFDLVTGYNKKAEYLRRLASERGLNPEESKFLEGVVRMSKIRDLPGFFSDLKELEVYLKRPHWKGANPELIDGILQKINPKTQIQNPKDEE